MRIVRGLALALTGMMDSEQKPRLLLQEVTALAIGAYYDVFNELAGFPEYVMCRALVVALQEAGLSVREEVSLPVWFRGRLLTTFRADLVVDPGLLIEVKAAPEIQPFHKAQLLHYLKASGLEVGLLFNFGRRPQIARMVYQQSHNRGSVSEEPKE